MAVSMIEAGNDQAVQMWRIKKLIKSLEEAKG